MAKPFWWSGADIGCGSSQRATARICLHLSDERLTFGRLRPAPPPRLKARIKKWRILQQVETNFTCPASRLAARKVTLSLHPQPPNRAETDEASVTFWHEGKKGFGHPRILADNCEHVKNKRLPSACARRLRQRSIAAIISATTRCPSAGFMTSRVSGQRLGQLTGKSLSGMHHKRNAMIGERNS